MGEVVKRYIEEKIMSPTVNGKHYSYTKKGRAAARKAAKKKKKK